MTIRYARDHPTMALFQISNFSKTLGKECELLVVTPAEQPGPMRVVYQLHGYGDAPNSWLRQTCIERYAQQHRLMVVMPEGGKGWYTDAANGLGNYESHLLETITFIDHHFRTVQSRCGRGIGGVGMGGYGALKMALKHSELFGAVAVHSACLHPFAHAQGSSTLLHTTFGESLSDDEDCELLAALVGRGAPAIHLDCGTRDEHHDECLEFHRHLKSLGIAHRFAEYPGGHNWSYWEAHLPEALTFHDQHLGYRGP